MVAEAEGHIIGMLNFRNGERKRIAHLGEFGMSVNIVFLQVGPAQAFSAVTPKPLSPSTSITLQSIAAISTSDVWSVGVISNAKTSKGIIEHWNGSAWSIVPNASPGSSYGFNGVAAVSASDAWSVGYNSKGNTSSTLIEHWNGKAWKIVASPNGNGSYNPLVGAAIVSATNIWVTGYSLGSTGNSHALIEHWNGKQWNVVASPSVGKDQNLLVAATALASNDTWTVSQYNNGFGKAYKSMFEHWDGTTWSIVPGPKLAQ